MHSISPALALQLAHLIGLASSTGISAAVISPVSVHVFSRDHTPSAISIDDSTNNSSSDSSDSSNLVLNQSLNFTSLNPQAQAQVQVQPSFCPYDSIHQPQPLLSYDLFTAPLASDCGRILEILNDTQRRGYWTFDTLDLEKGITLIQYKSCAFEMLKNVDGEILGGGGEKNNNKMTKQFKWGVEELKFYLGTWLQKQRHGRLGAVGEVDCWVEGEQKKEEGGGGGGVRVKWMIHTATAAAAAF